MYQYKLKSLLEKNKNIPADMLSKDSQEAIETVKILSDNFTTSDSPEAKELDELFSQLIESEINVILESAKNQLKIKDNPHIPKSTKNKAKKEVKALNKEKKKQPAKPTPEPEHKPESVPEPEKPVKFRAPILTKSQSATIEKMVNHYLKDFTHIKIEKLVRLKGNDKSDRSVIAICHDTNALFFPKTYRIIDGSGNVRKKNKKPKKGTYNIVLKEDFFKALYNPLYNKTECHAAAMKLRDMGDPQSAIYLMHNCAGKSAGKASFLRFTKAHELARKISEKEKITYREAYKKANEMLRQCKKGEICKL